MMPDSLPAHADLDWLLDRGRRRHWCIEVQPRQWLALPQQVDSGDVQDYSRGQCLFRVFDG